MAFPTDLSTLLANFLQDLADGALKTADGTAAAPSLTFASDTDTGVFRTASGLEIAVNTVPVGRFTDTGVLSIAGGAPLLAMGPTHATVDVLVQRLAANSLGLRNSTTAQTFTVGPSTGAVSMASGSAVITPGAGTGVTVVTQAALQRVVYQVTIAKEAFIAAAVTADVTLATLPAKTVLVGIYADVTAFALGADTFLFTIGSAAGGAQYMASLDAKATTLYGDADADLGTAMVRAAAIQGGAVSWAGNIVSLRLTSSATNLGTGSATSLTAGAFTIYLVTERLP